MLPFAPFVPFVHDGVISSLRTYSPSALRALAAHADPAIELDLRSGLLSPQVVVATDRIAGDAVWNRDALQTVARLRRFVQVNQRSVSVTDAVRRGAGPDPAKTARTALLASLVGTTIEWYDFFLYATAASLVFNQRSSPIRVRSSARMLSFATFAVGFVVRPIGGVVFGHIGDRIGRKTHARAHHVPDGRRHRSDGGAAHRRADRRARADPAAPAAHRAGLRTRR